MVHGKKDTRVRSIEFVFLIGGGRTVSRYTDVSGFRECCNCPAAPASLGTALRVMIGVCDSRDAFFAFDERRLSTSGQPASAHETACRSVQIRRETLRIRKGLRHYKDLFAKWLKTNKLDKSIGSAHNLKVTGSNPVPATN